MEVKLPGGLAREGSLEKRVRFRTLTGRFEQALLEADSGAGRAAYVTKVLSSALDSIGGEPADEEMTSRLCMADRHYLMLRLAAMLHGEHMWLNVMCSGCRALFDVEVCRCDLPIKEAGAEFPLARVDLDASRLEIRVPTGADQACIEGLSDEEAIRRLLQRCICGIDGKPPTPEFSDQLSDQDIDAIDEALDRVSPAVCTQLLVSCPECSREQQAQLDHNTLGHLDHHFFYDEVHSLAIHYHWSEAEILDLPLSRRRLYLDLISRSPARSEGVESL
jgi:hypothetical protein